MSTSTLPGGFVRWTPTERLLWIRQAAPQYAPHIPQVNLADKQYIDNMQARIDLRNLFPSMRGIKTPKVPCLWHKDTGHPSMGINRDYVKCFTCGQSTGFIEAVELLCRPLNREYLFAIIRSILGEVNTMPAKKQELPPLSLDEYMRNVRRLETRFADRRRWFEGKYAVSTDFQKRMYLGHSGGAFTFPVFGLDGVLQNIRYRKDPGIADPRFNGLPRYYGKANYQKTTWYIPPWIRGNSIREGYCAAFGVGPDNTRRIALVEGEIEVITLAAFGIPAISTTNGAYAAGDEELDVTMLKDCQVAVCFDNDPAGNTWAPVMLDRLAQAGVEAWQVLQPRIERPNGEWTKDIADLAAYHNYTRQDFIRLLMARQ